MARCGGICQPEWPVRHSARVDRGFAVVVVVVMGVSGSGKTTVGRLLATRLGWTFLEGDEFHPAANVDKMSTGVSLDDDDRWPWLERIRSAIEVCSRDGRQAVVACSALRARYREFLAAGRNDIRFVYLKGDRHTIRERMNARRDHYMKVDMLDSQLASLEEPVGAVLADVRLPPPDIVSYIMRSLGFTETRRVQNERR